MNRFVFMSVCLSICLSVCMSVCLYVCLSHFFETHYILQFIHFTDTDDSSFFFCITLPGPILHTAQLIKGKLLAHLCIHYLCLKELVSIESSVKTLKLFETELLLLDITLTLDITLHNSYF